MRKYGDHNSVLGVAVAVLMLAATAGAETAVIDDFSADLKTVRAAWRPMSGSPQASVAKIDGKRALRMICRFKGSDIDRASWDRNGAVDLSGHKGVQFAFRSESVDPVGHFTIYFHSGDGWYSAAFEAPQPGRWGQVKILKKDAGIEDKPGGWAKVDRIRISAWRGGDTDCEFQIAELAAFGAGGKIAIVRGDSIGSNSGEAKSVQQYAGVVANLLDSVGLDYTILSDADVSAERLKEMRLAILPYNPTVPRRVSNALADYMKRGGKLIACYAMPGELARQGGVRMGPHTRQKFAGYFASIRAARDQRIEGMPDSTVQASWNINKASAISGASRVAAWWHSSDGESTGMPAIIISDKCAFVTHVLLGDDPAGKRRLLLSLAGCLAPELWRDAAGGALKSAGEFERHEGSPKAESSGRAGRLEAVAKQLMAAGEYPQTISAAAELRKTLIEAHCLAQRPVAGEQKAFWCHDAFGVNGMTWDQAIRKLADNGFNAILPNMLWGGAAYYPSDVLPVASHVKTRGDQIAQCLAACRKYGVACHVWKVNYYMGRAAPPGFSGKLQAAGRTQVHVNGSSISDWLCPSHPANQKLEIDAMLEVARKYAVDGLHFDYIRYPGEHGCFCAGCRKRFEKRIGRELAWPPVFKNNPDLRKKWLDFRRDQITTVVAAVSQQARKIRPGIKISAAVFSNLPTDRDRIGQDWGLWCRRGYLDFVCPMDYTPNTGAFARLVAKQVKWAGEVPCCPGIGASVWTPRADPCKVIAQISAARKAGAKGFTIFNYSAHEAAQLLPMLSKGITRPKTGRR